MCLAAHREPRPGGRGGSVPSGRAALEQNQSRRHREVLRRAAPRSNSAPAHFAACQDNRKPPLLAEFTQANATTNARRPDHEGLCRAASASALAVQLSSSRSTVELPAPEQSHGNDVLTIGAGAIGTPLPPRSWASTVVLVSDSQTIPSSIASSSARSDAHVVPRSPRSYPSPRLTAVATPRQNPASASRDHSAKLPPLASHRR